MIDPAEYGLPSRTHLESLNNYHLALVINRKSRIIMSDGRKIMDKIEKIKSIQKNVKVSVKTNAPMCSKTLAFLKENKIDVIFES